METAPKIRNLDIEPKTPAELALEAQMRKISTPAIEHSYLGKDEEKVIDGLHEYGDPVDPNNPSL